MQRHLALWAFSHILLGIIEYIGSVVPLVDDHIGEEASTRVVPIVTIVNFLHHLSSLVWTKASYIWVEVETGVGFFV